MRLVKHRTGKHNVGFLDKLYIMFFSLFKKKITIKFTEESKYDLKDNDQKDWNKIIGRGGFMFKPSKGRKTEQFLVWRYNIEDDVFEVTTYWRKDYKFDFDRNYTTMKVGDKKTFDINFLKSPIPAGGYFGGNEVAPRRVRYYLS